MTTAIPFVSLHRMYFYFLFIRCHKCTNILTSTIFKFNEPKPCFKNRMPHDISTKMHLNLCIRLVETQTNMKQQCKNHFNFKCCFLVLNFSISIRIGANHMSMQISNNFALNTYHNLENFKKNIFVKINKLQTILANSFAPIQINGKNKNSLIYINFHIRLLNKTLCKCTQLNKFALNFWFWN